MVLIFLLKTLTLLYLIVMKMKARKLTTPVIIKVKMTVGCGMSPRDVSGEGQLYSGTPPISSYPPSGWGAPKRKLKKPLSLNILEKSFFQMTPGRIFTKRGTAGTAG